MNNFSILDNKNPERNFKLLFGKAENIISVISVDHWFKSFKLINRLIQIINYLTQPIYYYCLPQLIYCFPQPINCLPQPIY